MDEKYDLNWRIVMIMMFLCAAMVLIALPAAADYTADKNLTEKYSGIITGEMNYTIGDSYYSPKMWSNGSYVYTTTILEAIPKNAETVIARLYVYWTWSFNDTDPNSSKYDTGIPNPIMNVTLNGQPLTLEDEYNDTKGYDGYDYPCGTYCYNVTGNVTPGGVKSYVVNITNAYGSNYNQSFNIQAVGLFTLYNYTSSQKQYWIDEGCDLTNLKCTNSSATPIEWQDNRKPSNTRCWANFSNVDNSNVSSVTLITVAPSAGTIYNKLYFNSNPLAVFPGLWDGNPRDKDFSWDDTANVRNFLVNGHNYAIFQNGLDDNNPNTDGQMQAANAFLLVR